MTLEEVRNEIDEIDTNMKPLFLRRMKCGKHVAEVKAQTGGDVFVLERELEIIEKRATDVDPEIEHTQVKIGFTCPKETSDLNLFVNMTKLNGIQIDAMNLMTENGIQKVTMTLDGKITDAGMRCLLCQIGKEAEEFRILELF